MSVATAVPANVSASSPPSVGSADISPTRGEIAEASARGRAMDCIAQVNTWTTRHRTIASASNKQDFRLGERQTTCRSPSLWGRWPAGQRGCCRTRRQTIQWFVCSDKLPGRAEEVLPEPNAKAGKHQTLRLITPEALYAASQSLNDDRRCKSPRQHHRCTRPQKRGGSAAPPLTPPVPRAAFPVQAIPLPSGLRCRAAFPSRRRVC